MPPSPAYPRRALALLLHVALVFFLVRFFIVGGGRVEGTSMEPTLRDGDFFLVDKFTVLFRPPRRGEVIQFYHPGDQVTLLIKRVAAVPGDLILEDADGVSVVAGARGAPRWYARGSRSPAAEARAPRRAYVVPPHRYYVVGDSLPVSAFSHDFGLVAREFIKGRVVRLLQSSRGEQRGR